MSINTNLSEMFFTATHAEQGKYTLTCSFDDNFQILHLKMQTSVDSLPKIYAKIITKESLPIQLKFVYGSVLDLYKTVKDQENITVLYQKGIIRMKFTISSNKQQKQRHFDIQMERQYDQQINLIKQLIKNGIKGGETKDLQNMIEKLWKRGDDNEKIFMKFKEDIECKVQESLERMNIQNTKITIIQQDVHKIHVTLNKLTSVLCPIFNKIDVMSDFTNQFIFQDKKVVYIGASQMWTQILMKDYILFNRKYEFSFKVINSKKNNIVVGVAAASQIGSRSSIFSEKGQKSNKKYIGLSGTGQIYSSQSYEPIINLNLGHKSQSEKQGSFQKQQKTNHEITMTSPISQSIPTPKIMHSKSQQFFKPKQVIKMVVQFDKNKIYWKNGTKNISQVKLNLDVKNQQFVCFMQFYDTGDAVQFIDI